MQSQVFFLINNNNDGDDNNNIYPLTLKDKFFLIESYLISLQAVFWVPTHVGKF
jgi:hypothetical protein